MVAECLRVEVTNGVRRHTLRTSDVVGGHYVPSKPTHQPAPSALSRHVPQGIVVVNGRGSLNTRWMGTDQHDRLCASPRCVFNARRGGCGGGSGRLGHRLLYRAPCLPPPSPQPTGKSASIGASPQCSPCLRVYYHYPYT